MPDTVPYLGRTAALGIAAESTWGTAVSRTVWFPLVRESMARKVTKTKIPVLSDGVLATQRAHFIERDEAGGTVEILCTYEGFGLLWQHAMGTVATGAPSGGIYPHTYTRAASLPTGLTMEIVRGNGSSEVFEGCKISKMTVKIAAGGLMMVTLDIIGETSGGRASAGTPSYTTSRDLRVLHSQAGQFGWNSVNYDLFSLELSIDNRLERWYTLGSALTSQPQRTGYANITLKAELGWSSNAFNTALTADTEADGTITFTGGGSRSIAITLQNAYIDDVSDPVDGPGILKQSATFIGQDDGTDAGLKVIVSNTQSTHSDA